MQVVDGIFIGFENREMTLNEKDFVRVEEGEIQKGSELI